MPELKSVRISLLANKTSSILPSSPTGRVLFLNHFVTSQYIASFACQNDLETSLRCYQKAAQQPIKISTGNSFSKLSFGRCVETPVAANR